MALVTPRIAIIVSPDTPPYWLGAVVTAIESASAFDREVLLLERTVATASRPRATASSAVHVALLVDRIIRVLLPRAPHSREGAAFKPPALPVSMSRLSFEAAVAANGRPIADIAIALTSEPPDVVLSSRFRRGVLHATSAGLGLGASALAFVRSVAEAEPTMEIVVSRYTGAGGPGEVVMASRSSTRSLSPTLNDEMLAARVGDLLVLQCEKQLRAGRSEGEVVPRGATSAEYSAGAQIKLGASIARKLAQRRLSGALADRSFRSQWSLAYRRSAGESLQEGMARIPESEPLTAPDGVAWADPFPVHTEGRDLVFFEQEVRSEGRGHIAVAELLPDGRLSTPQRVLHGNMHLSYPHVFEHAGDWYMIPESRAAGTVTLYRATDFPVRWEKACDLLVGSRVADATVFEHEGRWWMFACRIGEGGSTFEDVILFQAPSLFGPWLPHAGNPVVSDATAGRPAGRIITEGSRLIRPAQDCSLRYGYGISFQSILRLSETAYSEERVGMRNPDWDRRLLGTHTFNRSSTVTFVDLLWRVDA